MSFVKSMVQNALVLAAVAGVAHAGTRQELEAQTRKYVRTPTDSRTRVFASVRMAAAALTALPLIRYDGSDKVIVKCLVSNYFSDGQSGGSFSCSTFVPLAK